MHAGNNDPLHGLTLEAIVTALVDHYGFKALSRQIEIRCFYHEPSVKSSLKFLRKTQWARTKVEELYISTFSDKKPTRKRNSSQVNTTADRKSSSTGAPNDGGFVWPSVKD
ncbi:MAG: VF530 family DNA-binding protein [Psychrobium sp.]